MLLPIRNRRSFPLVAIVFASLGLNATFTVAAHAVPIAQFITSLDLSDTDKDILAANPVLSALQAENPRIVRKALDEIEAAAAGKLSDDAGVRGFSGSGIPSPADQTLLDGNPGLRDVWRAAPEAAADLLALIRAAGGKKGKPAN